MMKPNFNYYELVNIWRQLPENTFTCGIRFVTSLKYSTNTIIKKLLHYNLIIPVKKESHKTEKHGRTYERNVYIKAEYDELSRVAKRWLKKINFSPDYKKLFSLFL